MFILTIVEVDLFEKKKMWKGPIIVWMGNGVLGKNNKKVCQRKLLMP